MKKPVILAATIAAAAVAGPPALAAGGPMAVINQYNDLLNKGDGAAAAKLCGSGVVIIDDFPPHVWQGANTCADWWSAAGAYFKKNGITDNVVTLHKPWRVTVTGDRAYAVIPVTLTYKLNGKPMVESGSVLTAIAQKVGVSWRIKGFSWAQH